MTGVAGGTILAEAQKIRDWIVDRRRNLHRHPELAYHEVETSRYVRETLEELGIAFRWPVAETGVVATIGDTDAPCVALRADMDALPIREETDIEFRSEIDGAMHACGHDCHTSMLLGAAKLLKGREADLGGCVKLLFQPAEEGGAGAERMCDEGALESPSVKRVFGLHVWPLVPTGTLGGRAGVFLASAGKVRIIVRGVGGHGAMPHLAVDPVVSASKLVVELQTIVSREIDPLDSGVVSITSVHGGNTHNVIPGEVELYGTIRSLSLEGLGAIQDRIRDIARLVCEANRCSAEVSFPGNDYPPTVNDEGCWSLLGEIAEEMLGSDTIIEGPPVMGGEDFSYYLQRVPGCFAGLGIRNEEFGSTYNVHHPCFLVDEGALPIGSALHVAFALRSLSEL